jgi:tetrahydromethanopterin S-methyltransferase subunit C
MASAAPDGSAPRKKSVFELIGEIPTLVSDLVQREIELVKTELVTKLKALGVGAGIIAAALLVLLAMLGVLLTAAIFALTLTGLPGWAAALIVAGVLLIIAVILGLIGYRILKRGVPPVPTESIESIKRDIRAIKGMGKRGES